MNIQQKNGKYYLTKLMNAISFIKIMNILKKNGKYYPQDKLELKRLVSNENVYLADIDTSAVSDMSELFKYSKRVNFSGIECWDVSNVENMADMFNGAKHFNVALDEWDLNKNINFNGMFDNTNVSFKEIFKYNKSLKKYHPQTKNELKELVDDESIFLGDIDTSAVTDMSKLFHYSRRKDFSGIESWDVSNVKNMSYMFGRAYNFNGDISGWNVSNVKYMSGMFFNAKNFNSDISGWNVSNVEDMSKMFYGAKINFKTAFKVTAHYQPQTKDELQNLVDDENVYLGDIDTSAITDMGGLFENSRRKDFSGIECWDVSNVENMYAMFYEATNFNSNISSWDVSKVKDMSEMFWGATNFNGNISNWDVSNVEDMRWMFNGAEKFNRKISSWDVSNVENMRGMFCRASNFNGNISGWDVSNVKNMSYMFYGAKINFKTAFKVTAHYHPQTKDELKKLVNDENIFLGRIDTSAITDMSGLFEDSGRRDFSGIETWDVSNVKDMSKMFSGAENFNGDISGWDIKDEISIYNLGLQNYPENCTIPKNENGKYKPKKALELHFIVRNKNIALRDIDTSEITDMSGLFRGMDRDDFDDISGWDVSNVEDMSWMFGYTENFNGNISGWDVSNVKYMSSMFYCATNFNSNISSWDVSKVKDMSEMFWGATNFNSNISNWDVSNVKNMGEMFSRAENFNSDISGWDVSNVEDMSWMFCRATNFNSNISNWDVSNVENMRGMFCRASNFNGDISGWDVGNVKDMSSMFYEASNFNGNISGWDVSNVKDMSEMFRGAENFNSNISSWDVSNVKDMSYMFYEASDFNSDISGWDVSNVENMSKMFSGAWNFNSDISNWNVSRVENMREMFYGASNFNSDLSNWDVSNVKDMSKMFWRAENFNGNISGWEMFYEAEAEVIDYESLSWNKMWRDLVAETEREYVESLLKQR